MPPGLSVLVVEDDAALRRVLELRLQLEGFRVSTAKDGRDALDILDEARPDIVVSDIMMPRLDGLGFCRQVRGRAGLQDLPIVLLTARQRDAEIDEVLRLGGIVYMPKPFDAPLLARTLRGLIGDDAALAG